MPVSEKLTTIVSTKGQVILPSAIRGKSGARERGLKFRKRRKGCF